MKYIKHPEHGILAVPDITNTHKRSGWRQIDINQELGIVTKNVTEQMIVSGVSEVDHEPVIAEFLANKFSPKAKFEEYARTFGCELDRRKNKANMVKEFRQWLQSET